MKNDVNEGIGEWGDWGKLGQTSWGTLICLSYEGGRLSTGHRGDTCSGQDTRVGGEGPQDCYQSASDISIN